MSQTTYLCPKGHLSTEADFCSDCGAKIQATSDPAVSPIPTSATTTALVPCPDCGTVHDPGDGNFCDVCGYNFLTGASGSRFDPGVSAPSLVPVPVEAIAVEPIAESMAAAEMPSLNPLFSDHPPLTPSTPAPTQEPWYITLTVDPSLGTAESPPAPSQAAITLPLMPGTYLVGRTSEGRGIFPEVPLDFDSAVSHRHALLILQKNGTLNLRDVGSSNGTYINGVEVKPMVDTVLQNGDEFTLGHWTRVQVSQP